ncbi:MAG: glycosyltransferase family 9 protein [Campylobacterota bacterium]|nr:glycosyltransferase family 9 protein [Campylobacterota bacterium]
MQNDNITIFIELPTWLGDAVMTTPAIENILSYYRNSELIIFGSFISTKLFVNHPRVKKIIIDESKKSAFRYKNLYTYAKSIGKVDIAFSFRKNFTTKLLFFFIDSDFKYIYKRYDKIKTKHQVIRYNEFIDNSLGIKTTPSDLKIYLPKGNKKDIKSKPILGINAGATYGSAKRWYVKEFADVAISLSDKYDIIIFGGGAEVNICNDIENEFKNSNITNYINLAGKTSVEELILNISNLNLFITNDSGPMHIAAAFKIKTVSIFGPTRYKETNQWNNPNEILIRKDLDCSPCMKRVCPLKTHECMKLITSKDVLEKLTNK